MKTREKKLALHRETLHRLVPRPLAAADLAAVRGGQVAPAEDTGRWSSCGRPNCCDDTLNGTL